MSPRLTTLALAGGIAVALVSLSARADDDRFVLRVGAMQADATSQLRGSAQFLGQDYNYQSGHIDLGDQTVPRVEGEFHFSNRNRLLFNYFRFDKTNRYGLGEDVSFDDVTIPAGSQARLDTQFDLGSVVYDFAVVETPNISFGLQIGAEWARIKARVDADDTVNYFTAQESESGTAPVVGARFAAHTADRTWGFIAQAQYLDAGWGNFDDYDGSISRANALVEYRFTRNVGVFVGYDWFKLDVSKSGRDGYAGLDQRFKGPTAGLTFAF